MKHELWDDRMIQAGFFLTARIGEVTRKTKETDVKVSINLDGTGICRSNTGIPFLDHMLDVSAIHWSYHVAM